MFGSFFGGGGKNNLGSMSKNIFSNRAIQPDMSQVSPDKPISSMDVPGAANMDYARQNPNNPNIRYGQFGLTPGGVNTGYNQNQEAAQVFGNSQRAMAPGMGFDSFMAPQAAGNNTMLHNMETGQALDLSKNKPIPGFSDLISQFKGRIFY